MINGQTISDRYRLGKLLGEGGSGAVHQGIDLQSGETVAIKVLKPEIVAGNPEKIKRFVREAEALRALNHPHIVQVLDLVTQAENHYLVMEYVPGGSLRRLLNQNGPLSVAKTLEIGLDLADALTRAHRLNIIHRDLKPANILLAADGTPRLADFGLARFEDPSVTEDSLVTHEGAVMGTIDYLSPEACRGDRLDARADIWGLGIVIFELLTGTRPFTGPSTTATMVAILNQPTPDIKQHCPDVPESLKQLIDRMLAKERENRIPSVRLVGAELETMLNGPISRPAPFPVPDTLLLTKLLVPPQRPNLVARSRLTDLLNTGITAKLTLISAPAGFGKTTLLSTWAQTCGLPAAWLSLNNDDNDAVTFLTYLIHALQQATATSVGQATLTMLKASAEVSNPGLNVLINDLAHFPDDILLFLDDYHIIDNAVIHTALTYLVDNLPPNGHLFLCSRSDPPLPLSRLRARGQLLEIRQADLRFTAVEAHHYFNQSMGLHLSTEQIAALETRTEGWIAGLQLAALSLRGKADVSGFVEAFSGSHRFIIDYLADEILAQQPETIRQFLQQTAILDRFTAPLCDAVTGRDDATAVLQLLAENNLFLFPLDERREWYRYHQLFNDFLRAGLQAEQETALHKKAATWFLAQSLYAEGVKHALACADVTTAEKAILLAAPAIFDQGSLNILGCWLDALPEETVLANSELAIYKGFVLFISRSEEKVPPYLHAAENNLIANAPSSVLGRLLSLKAHMAICEGRYDECVALSREALETLVESDLSFRNLTFNVLGQVLELKGDVASAVAVYEQAFQAGWQAGDLMGALVIFTNLIFSLNELGQRHEAITLCQQLSAEMESMSVQGFSLVDAVCLAWSLLSLEANELKTAQEQAQRALGILTAVNFTQGLLWGHYILARVHLARGEFETMFQLTQKGLRLAQQASRETLHGAWFLALEAEAQLQQGHILKTTQWAEAAGLAAGDNPSHWGELPYFTFTRLLLAQDRLGEAQQMINTLATAARQGGRGRKLITTHLLQARLQLAQKKQGKAVEQIEHALKIAAPENYGRAFLDEGPLITNLLPRVRAAAPAFVAELTSAPDSMTELNPQAEALVEPLSERELEVLRLAAQGLSNRQIAEALFVTVGTIKKHLNNIFSKLNVKNRTQAFNKARQFGLIE